MARFLDQADCRIQRYLRAKHRLIVLLEEMKQAVIDQAVTGQIDVRTGRPYSAYKPSGVPWLGDMPKHWERCRLKNVVSAVTTGSRAWSSYAADAGPLFIRVANLSRGSLKLRFDEMVRLSLPETSEAGRTRVEAGDLLISVTAYIGSIGVATDDLEEAYGQSTRGSLLTDTGVVFALARIRSTFDDRTEPWPNESLWRNQGWPLARRRKELSHVTAAAARARAVGPMDRSEVIVTCSEARWY